MVYGLVWKVVPLIATAVFYDRGQEYVLLRLLLETSTEVLLLVPFLVPRIGGTRVGWLHPLVFTTLLLYAIGGVRNTQSLLHPFTVWFRPIEQPFSHRLLHGWLAIDVAEVHVKAESLILLSTFSLYAGFILFRPRLTRLRFGIARDLSRRVVLIFAVLFAITVAFVETSGGITQHISSFALGRFRSLSGLGHITALIAFAPALMLIWFVFDKHVIKRPWYWAAVVLSLGMQFVTNGSRSATLMPTVLIAMGWIYHHRRVPAARIIPLGVVALVGIGVLGEIRTSSWSQGSADFSALTEFDMAESIETAEEELDARTQNAAFLPTIAFVPDRVGLLWGQTYIGAITFFVPRAIWRGKPRGAGPHVAAMIFRGLPSADGYEGGGIPPGPVAEAYWNFHVPGVILVFALFGAFQRWISELLRTHDGEPAVIVSYILVLFYMPSPTSDSVIEVAQKLGVLSVVYLTLGVLPFARVSRGTGADAGARTRPRVPRPG